MKRPSVHDCQLLELPRIYDRGGNITPLHGGGELPFDIKRVYYLYDVQGGESRGGHAHKNLQQLIVAATGSFDLVLFDGKEKKTIQMNRPYQGVFIKPGIWRTLENFSSGSICLVLASDFYDETDYIRDYDDYLKYIDRL